MKKSLTVTIAMAAWMTSFAVLPVSAADSPSYCGDRQAFKEFAQETAELSRTLKAKELELSNENIYTVSEASPFSSPDYGKISALESEIKEIKGKINAVAMKHDIAVCCQH